MGTKKGAPSTATSTTRRAAPAPFSSRYSRRVLLLR